MSAATEIVARMYAAFAERDLVTIFALLAVDVEITQSAELPWGGVYHGHDGARTFLTKLTAAIRSAVEVERVIDAGDEVAVVGWTTGTITGTDTRFRVPLVHLWTVAHGQVQRVRFCIDNPAMLEALAATKR